MRSFSSFSEGYPDWKERNNADSIKGLTRSYPWHWINGEGMQGRVLAGNIEVLDWILATRGMKDLLFLLETSEEMPAPVHMSRMLRSLAVMGFFEGASGIAFGRFRGYSKTMRMEMWRSVMQVLLREQELDFGHTDPYFPIPVRTKIRIEEESIELLESFAT